MFIYFNLGVWNVFPSVSKAMYIYLFIYIAGGIRGNKEVKINKKKANSFC